MGRCLGTSAVKCLAEPTSAPRQVLLSRERALRHGVSPRVLLYLRKIYSGSARGVDVGGSGTPRFVPHGTAKLSRTHTQIHASRQGGAMHSNANADDTHEF
eukprot:COSAG06_NODE_1224_length_10198_cov_15.139816_11_plen_101_part_00